METLNGFRENNSEIISNDSSVTRHWHISHIQECEKIILLENVSIKALPFSNFLAVLLLCLHCMFSTQAAALYVVSTDPGGLGNGIQMPPLNSVPNSS